MPRQIFAGKGGGFVILCHNGSQGYRTNYNDYVGFAFTGQYWSGEWDTENTVYFIYRIGGASEVKVNLGGISANNQVSIVKTGNVYCYYFQNEYKGNITLNYSAFNWSYEIGAKTYNYQNYIYIQYFNYTLNEHFVYPVNITIDAWIYNYIYQVSINFTTFVINYVLDTVSFVVSTFFQTLISMCGFIVDCLPIDYFIHFLNYIRITITTYTETSNPYYYLILSIPLLIILLVPTLIIYAKFKESVGSIIAVPIFAFMSIVCYLIGLMPLWILLIIIFGSAIIIIFTIKGG